jgi:hypothetical protein
MKFMRTVFLLLITLHTPLIAIAETKSPFSALQNEGMQNLMLNMQEIQNCMAKIDQNELLALSEQAQATQTKIESYCESNDTENAKKSALELANTIKNSTAAKKAQECLKDIPDMMKGHIQGADINQLQSELEKKDVCSLSF